MAVPLGSPISPSSSETNADRSFSALLADLASETSVLFREELALFTAELREKLGLAGRAGIAVVAGGVMLSSGWLALLAAAILGLSTVLAPWLAALIVGAMAVAIGVVLLFVGKRGLDGDLLVPRRTIASLREDEAWLKERIRSL